MLRRWLAHTWLLRGGSGRLGPSLAIGLALSAAVAAAGAMGWLGPLERVMLDWRFQQFQYASPAPTDRLVHIDIGDQTITRFGRWPWPRGRIAGLVDELNRAGAKVIAFDVLFLEPQPVRYERGQVPVPLLDRPGKSDQSGRSTGKTQDQASSSQKSSQGEDQPYYVLDDDALLAAALRRADSALLPIAQRHASETAGDPDRSALPASFRRSTRPVPKHWADLANDRITRPIDQLAAAAAGTGFVDYQPSEDGVVRTLRLWRRADDRLYPQLGLSVACRLMDVELAELRITERATVLPGGADAEEPSDSAGHSGPLRLPHLPRARATPPGRGRVLLPWTDWVLSKRAASSKAGGGASADSATSSSSDVAQPRSVRGWQVLQIRRMRQQIDLTVMQLAGALKMAGNASDYAQTLRRIRTQPQAPDAYQQLLSKRQKLRDEILSTARMYRKDFQRIDDLRPTERNLRDQLVQSLSQFTDLRQRLKDARAELKNRVNGKACFVGLPATGLSDVVPTPRSAETPGVRVHSAMANAILSNHFIQRAGLWVDLLLVVAIGGAASLLAARLAPLLALLGTLALAAGFVVTNGLVLDFLDRWLVLAGPVIAAAMAWSGITLFRLVTEQRIKARITRQFKSYVSQDLVDYLAEHPELVYLSGQRREISCLFVDLAGFTDLSEKLGPEQSVKLLNTVLGAVARQLMQHRALVNKFLGDGLMAFWGAPIENPNHAMDACRGALAASKAMRQIESAELPVSTASLTLRIGITSGTVMVGDFGAPPDRSDYTVLGDNVNLASRLEAANKQLGTGILISDRTKRQAETEFLTRPVGKIVVVGRSEPEPVHELIETHAEASEQQRDLAEATERAVQAYESAAFAECIELFDAMAERFGQNKLAARYQDACREHLQAGTPAEDFPGTLVLTSK